MRMMRVDVVHKLAIKAVKYSICYPGTSVKSEK